MNTHVYFCLFRLNAKFVINTLKQNWSTIIQESTLRRSKESLESLIEEAATDHHLFLIESSFDYYHSRQSIFFNALKFVSKTMIGITNHNDFLSSLLSL